MMSLITGIPGQETVVDSEVRPSGPAGRNDGEDTGASLFGGMLAAMAALVVQGGAPQDSVDSVIPGGSATGGGQAARGSSLDPVSEALRGVNSAAAGPIYLPAALSAQPSQKGTGEAGSPDGGGIVNAVRGRHVGASGEVPSPEQVPVPSQEHGIEDAAAGAKAVLAKEGEGSGRLSKETYPWREVYPVAGAESVPERGSGNVLPVERGVTEKLEIKPSEISPPGIDQAVNEPSAPVESEGLTEPEQDGPHGLYNAHSEGEPDVRERLQDGKGVGSGRGAYRKGVAGIKEDGAQPADGGTDFAAVMGTRDAARTAGNADLKAVDSHGTTARDRMADIARQIVEQGKVLKYPDRTEVEIRLKPEMLGRVVLNLSMREGRLSARFTVSEPEVKSAIESRMEELRKDLGDQGLQVGDISVSVGDGFHEEQKGYAYPENGLAGAWPQKGPTVQQWIGDLWSGGAINSLIRAWRPDGGSLDMIV